MTNPGRYSQSRRTILSLPVGSEPGSVIDVRSFSADASGDVKGLLERGYPKWGFIQERYLQTTPKGELRQPLWVS